MSKEGGRLNGRIRDRWLRLSLKQKMRLIAGFAVTVVILSITGNVVVSGFGMQGFEQILQNNSKSLELWKAAGEEARTFKAYVDGRTGEQRADYEAARERTRQAVLALPFDYESIGPNRYAKTWSIRNLYDTYADRRDRFLT